MPRPTSDRRATERKQPWPMVRLGDVCEVEFGTRVRRKDSQGGDYPVYGGGGATFYWNTYNREDQCIVSRFAMSEECVRFVKGKFFLNDSGLSVRSDSKSLSQTYLDWALYSRQPEIYALGRGAAQKNLDVEQFANMMLPLPPLSVQREIVARLERELAAVEKMKKGFEALAETARAEFKAELKEVFEEISRGGAETRRLGEVCDVFRGDYITRKTEQAGAIPVVLGGREPGYYINRSNHEGPCLVVSRSGASAGYVSYWNEPIFITDGFGIETGDSIDARFLHYQMLKNGGFASDQDGAAIPHVTGGVIRDYEVLVPPLANQREVVARLDGAKAKAEKLEGKAREGVAICDTMRKAILKEAFDDGRASPAIGKATGR